MLRLLRSLLNYRIRSTVPFLHCPFFPTDWTCTCTIVVSMGECFLTLSTLFATLSLAWLPWQIIAAPNNHCGPDRPGTSITSITPKPNLAQALLPRQAPRPTDLCAYVSGDGSIFFPPRSYRFRHNISQQVRCDVSTSFHTAYSIR